MIKKRIDIPTDLSTETVFQIIEMYFEGRYKPKRHTDSILKVKRLYKYQSSFGWNKITKPLCFNDSGYFQISDNQLSFSINLTKQIVFWSLIMISGFFILWKLFHVSFVICCFLIFIPLIIGWINGLNELKQFVKYELERISKKLND